MCRDASAANKSGPCWYLYARNALKNIPQTGRELLKENFQAFDFAKIWSDHILVTVTIYKYYEHLFSRSGGIVLTRLLGNHNVSAT